LRGTSRNTTQTDMYAFGILLYETISRSEPYYNEENDAQFDAREVLQLVMDPTICKRPSPIPPSCPPPLKTLMTELLLDDSTKRPTSEEVNVRIKRLDVTDVMCNKQYYEESSLNVDGGNSSITPKMTKLASSTSISLYDIFPKHVAEALQDGREVEAEHREEVTIFFSDIVGFTTISSSLPPRKVASLLDRLYRRFDALSFKHDIFKVETIGDAYMAVSNLVKDQPNDHAKRIANFAFDAIQAAQETIIELDDDKNNNDQITITGNNNNNDSSLLSSSSDNNNKNDNKNNFVSIRVGFHSGPVVADVVGTRNPRYCLFGDTVNTAARMESTGRANKLHCSEASANLLRQQCPALPLISRGYIPIKGKGNMHTYWVHNTNNTNNETTIIPESEKKDYNNKKHYYNMTNSSSKTAKSKSSSFLGEGNNNNNNKALSSLSKVAVHFEEP